MSITPQPIETARAGAPGASPARGRLASLDAFRGLTMASMVIVNNPGSWASVYAPLRHAEWHGWTPTDLVFPFFLFIVGVSATMSQGTTGTWIRIVRRALVIAALGLLLAGFPRFPLETWRVPGVLQRIALCYLASVAVFRASHPRGGPRPFAHGVRLGIWAGALLAAYWAILMLVPVPGGDRGDLSPEGNVGAYLDRLLLGQHLWGRRPWDPEGLLSTIPAIGTTLLGMIAGLWLRAGAPPRRTVLTLAGAGLIGVVAGLAWDLVFPINKNLWTSSYALFSGGTAAVVLAVCHWLVDVRGWTRWSRPFVVLGVNAITLFVASGLLTKSLIAITLAGPDGRRVTLYHHLYATFYQPWLPPNVASLLFAASHLVLLYGLCALLYRRRVFLRA